MAHCGCAEDGGCTVSIFVATREQLDAIKKHLHLNLDLSSSNSSCFQGGEGRSFSGGLSPSAAAAKEGLESGTSYLEAVGGSLEASLFFQKNSPARYSIAFYVTANNFSQELPDTILRSTDFVQALLNYSAEYTYGTPPPPQNSTKTSSSTNLIISGNNKMCAHGMQKDSLVEECLWCYCWHAGSSSPALVEGMHKSKRTMLLNRSSHQSLRASCREIES